MDNNLTDLLDKFSKLGIVELDRNSQPIKDQAPEIELTPAEKAIRLGELAQTITPEQYFQQAPQINLPVQEVIPPGPFGATDVDLIEKGALNSTLTDMWNSFKKGIDETQKSAYFGKLVDYQEIIDKAPDQRSALEAAYKNGQIDENTYSESIAKIDNDLQEAYGKVDKYIGDIEEQETEINKEPVSKRYQVQSALTQAEGSKAGLWDSFIYTVPETAGSSASLLGQQLAATFGTGVAKKLIGAAVGAVAPEPVASKIAAASALTSALALIANSRREESFAEVGDAVQTAQSELLNRWMEANPGATPTEEDLRQIRLESYKGKDDLFWQNMSLAGLDLIESVLLPGSKIAGLFETGAALERGLKGIRDYNKYTRMGSYAGAAYADWIKEKFEEGYQYAAQQRQYNEALNLKLYDNKGFMKNIMSDAFDALGSLDYSPIGIARDSEGRYSHDPNFQFAEGSGGMLALFGNGVSIPYKAAKDIYLYNKVNKELGKDPFDDAADKVFKLKSEILFKHFENDTVHHLVEGLKSLSKQTDEQGQPVLSKEDLNKEIGNIAIANDRYQTVNSYIESFSKFFPSKELKETKRILKQDLFDTVLRLSNYEGQISKLSAQKSRVSSSNSAVGELMDLDSQIQARQELIRQLQNETEQKVNPDDAVLYDYDKKLAILKNQVKKLEKDKAEKLKYLPEEQYKKYKDINLGKDPSKIEDYDPLTDNISIDQENINRALIAPTVHRDLYANRYAQYRSMKSLDQAEQYLGIRIKESKEKQDIIDKNQPEEKTEVEQTPDENPDAFNEPEGPATEGTQPEPVKKPVTGATAQRIGTLEEHPIISEFEDTEGFMNYEIMKPDGTTEVVSQKGTWYKTNEIPETNEARVEPRHKLYGPDHFMRPFRYNLSKEQAALRKVAKRLNVSVEEILRRYPEAFPAHANDLLLKKILATTNPKDFIDIIVTDRFSQKNTGYDPIVFSSSTGLVGLRTNGISMLLRLTDPDDTTKQLELFEIYPPDFYAEVVKKGDQNVIIPIDFTNSEQMNLEKFNSMFMNFGKDFTQEEFEEFVRTWKAVKEFKTALQTGLKGKDITTQPAVLGKDAYDLSITGEFDYITGLKKPFIKIKDSDLLKNAPIYYFDTDPSLNHWVTKNTMTPGYRLKEGTVGYYAAVETPAGFRWVKLTPGKIVSPDERETTISKEIKRVVDELYELDVNQLDSHEKAKKIVKSMDFYIASYGNLVITPFAKEQNGHYTLDYSLTKGEVKAHAYMDKFLKSGAEVDYNYKFIKDRINNALTEKGIPDQINENNFRYNPSKDITEETYDGDVKDLFDATVNPNVVKNLTPKFYLGANRNNVSDKTPTAVSPSPELVSAPTDSIQNDAPTLNNSEKLSTKEQEEKDRESGAIDDIFAGKLADRGDIDYPLTLQEQEEYLSKMLPEGFTRADLNTLHTKVAKNGILVGAVVDKAVYLRDVADKSDLFHEAFHVVFRNLLTNERIETYLNKAASELKYTKEKLDSEKNKLRESGIYDGYTDQQLEDQVYEEYLADNFFEWKKGQEKKSWLKQLFDKIMNLIRFFTTDDVRGLYAAIDRGYFKNSSILKTKYNSKGSTNTAYKLLVGATQIQSSDITNQVLAKVIVDGMTTRQAINYFVEFYNPESVENEVYISSNPAIQTEFKKFQDIFLDSANQRILHEVIAKKLESYGISAQTTNQILEDFEVVEDTQVDEKPEKQWDLTDAYVDPYTRVGRKIKSIMDTTTYTSYFNGKPYQRVLDSRLFYGRMLPVLSISNLPGEMIMSKLRTLGKWDPQVKAFYERLMELTGYSHETGEVNGVAGRQIYNSLVKAFEVEQMLYFEPVSNITEGKPIVNSVNILNKADLGKYRITEWSNYWRSNVLDGVLKDSKAKGSIIGSFTKFISALDERATIDRTSLSGLKSALDKLGIKLEMPYLVYSFGTTEEAEELKENFSLRGMTREDLIQISKAVSEENDLYAKTTSVNKWGAQGRMLDIANGHAQFDSTLILRTYLDPENKVRYAYVSSNYTLAETRRLKSLTTEKAIKQEMAKFNGYYGLNPLFTDSKVAMNIFSNLNIGLTNNFRTAFDTEDKTSKQTKEVKNQGVTGTEMDADTMMGVMHILFSSSFKTAATKVKYGRYWLSQISDKNTQYAVEMPVTNFWTGSELTEDAKQKLFNLVKQEYLRNKGTYWDYIKKDKFLYFPFLSKKLLEGTVEELEAQKNDIVTQIEKEFKQLVETHKKDLRSKGLMKGNNFVFLDNESLVKEYGSIDNYLTNFMLNHFIYTTGVLQFYAGDIAWTKGWDDFVKRMAGAIASGNTLGDQEIINIHATDVLDYLDKDTLNPAKKGDENAKENNTADAQVWSTAYTKKVVADALGELSPTLSSAFDKIMLGNDKALTKQEKLELDLISDKLVGFGPDTDGNRQYNKQSTFYLTLGLTSMQDKTDNWVAQPHRVALHNIRTYLEKMSENKQGILLSPKSANKEYKAPNPVEMRDFEGSVEAGKEKSIKTDPKAVTRISGNYIRKQQENDTKSKDNIVFVRQLIDVLGSEIKDPKTRSMISQFREDLAAIRNEAFDFASKLVVKKVKDVYERADLSTWIENLKHNIEITTPDNQMLEFLSFPDVDLNLPHIQNKTKIMFLNTFKKAFQKKVSGRKVTLVSSYGFKVIIDKKTGKVVPTETIVASKNPDLYTNTDNYEIRDLNIHKIDKDSEGNIVKQEAEVLMTRKTAELRGVNITDPTKEDYMKVFGVRIPLQSYHSTLVGKIVDFLPDYYGDVIVAPKEVVYLGGMDYDVDSLYMFMPNMFINQDGETVMYGKETSDEEKFYGFKHYLLKNNTIISQEVYKLLLQNDDFRALKLDLSMGEDLGEALNSTIIISILDGEVKDKVIKRLTEDTISTVLQKFGYPSTLEAFVASGIESEGTVQNRMYQNVYAIMMSEELADAYKQPANHDKIDASISYLERIGALDINRKADVIPNTPVSISNAYANATQGKNLTGISVNANTVGATLTEYKIRLKTPRSIIFGVTKDEEGRDIPKIYSSFESDSKSQRIKADAGSTTVTGTVDNANKPVSRDLNFSRHTLPQRNILIQLGETDYEFIDSMFTLPTMRELVQKLDSSSRVLSRMPYSLRLHIMTLSTRIQSIVNEMNARGDGAGGDSSLLKSKDNTIDKLKSEVFTKQDLEKVHQLSKSIFVSKSPTDMSNEELKTVFEYYVIQMMALNVYDQLNHIADYAQHISRIMSLNRKLVPDLGFLPEYLESTSEILSSESPFEVGEINDLLANPNVASNLKNIQDVLDMSKLFFLENTDFFKKANDEIFKNFSVKRDEAADIRRNFLSFITMKLLKHDRNISFDSYYQYVLPGFMENSKTLSQQFNELTKVNSEGTPLNPEFYNNPFVKILEPMMAKDNQSSAIDILGIDSRAKFSAETLDKYMDSIQSMFRSQNKEISSFATNMVKYLIAKDSLQFKNYSFIKLLPATIFANIAKNLSKLNTEIAYESADTSKIKDLTGQSSNELYKEFMEIHGRLNPGSAFKMYLGSMTEDGIPISDNLVVMEKEAVDTGIEKGTYQVFKYTMSDKGMTLTQNLTDFRLLSKLPQSFKNFVEHQGNEIFSIEFPSILSVNGNKAYIYVETSRTKSQGKVTVNYKKASALNTKGILPYFASIEATEKASSLISETLRNKKKKSAIELESSVALDLEPEVTTESIAPEVKAAKPVKDTILLKDGKEYLPSQINGKMLTMMGYSAHEAGEIIKNLCA